MESKDATGYRICWKTASDTTYIDCIEGIDPDITSLSMLDSPFDDTYYYAIQAYNSFGNSSDFSGEVEVKGIPENLAKNLKIRINNENNIEGVTFQIMINYNTDDVASYPLKNGTYDLIDTHFLAETDIQVTVKQGDKVLEMEIGEDINLGDFRMENDILITLDCDSMGIVVTDTSRDEGNAGGSNDDISEDINIKKTSLNDDNNKTSCFITSLLE